MRMLDVRGRAGSAAIAPDPRAQDIGATVVRPGESAGSPEGDILLAPGVSPGRSSAGPRALLPNRRRERWFKLEVALRFENPGLTPGASRMPPPAGAQSRRRFVALPDTARSV